jgi:hypothetical protein
MIIYLAITSLIQPYTCLRGADVLSSYYYCQSIPGLVKEIPNMRNFLLDSGIFTFINSGKYVNMDEYIRNYAAFIRDYNIRDYVELDVDQIEGVEQTRRIRDKLENLVGWQSIPVWHTIRGTESFIKDATEYKKICLGFFLTEGLSTKVTEKYAPKMISLAHKHNCKIHGLGFTKTTLLPKFHFDSVDSSTWSMGKRFGSLSVFDKETGLMKQVVRPKGMKANGAIIERYNLQQWRLFQDYAIKNLPTI